MNVDEEFDVLVDAEVKDESAYAFLLYDGMIYEWVPKSLVSKHRDGQFGMPRWLAEERGFEYELDG